MMLTEANFRIRFNWRTTDPLPVDWMEQLSASDWMEQLSASERLRTPMRPRMPPPCAPECDLYFYPVCESPAALVPVLRVRVTNGGYLFQGLDAACMDIQFETFHVSIADALEQVVWRMRIERGVIRWDAKGL